MSELQQPPGGEGTLDKKVILAVGLSLVILVGWNYLFPPPKPKPAPAEPTAIEPSTSDKRSRSERPVGGASIDSQSTSPDCTFSAMSRPLSRPPTTVVPSTTGLADPRSVSAGVDCSTAQSCRPS